ncbi:hypothetical protein GQ457_15G026740 [Hibiscus cannabinus]
MTFGTDTHTFGIDTRTTVSETKSDLTACSSVGRDLEGNWCFGFSRALGLCFVLEAELWDVYERLAMTWSLGYNRVIVEMDYRDAYDMLAHRNSHNQSTTVPGSTESGHSPALKDKFERLTQRASVPRVSKVPSKTKSKHLSDQSQRSNGQRSTGQRSTGQRSTRVGLPVWSRSGWLTDPVHTSPPRLLAAGPLSRSNYPSPHLGSTRPCSTRPSTRVLPLLTRVPNPSETTAVTTQQRPRATHTVTSTTTTSNLPNTNHGSSDDDRRTLNNPHPTTATQVEITAERENQMVSRPLLANGLEKRVDVGASCPGKKRETQWWLSCMTQTAKALI